MHVAEEADCSQQQLARLVTAQDSSSNQKPERVLLFDEKVACPRLQMFHPQISTTVLPNAAILMTAMRSGDGHCWQTTPEF